MDYEEEGFVEWVETEEGSMSEWYARSNMEYCTRLEVEYFESEGMRRLVALQCWSSFLHKEIEHRVSRAARADLVRAVAAYLEGE